jgi:hypothetical protein
VAAEDGAAEVLSEVVGTMEEVELSRTGPLEVAVVPVTGAEVERELAPPEEADVVGRQ